MQQKNPCRMLLSIYKYEWIFRYVQKLIHKQFSKYRAPHWFISWWKRLWATYSASNGKLHYKYVHNICHENCSILEHDMIERAQTRHVGTRPIWQDSSPIYNLDNDHWTIGPLLWINLSANKHIPVCQMGSAC